MRVLLIDPSSYLGNHLSSKLPESSHEIIKPSFNVFDPDTASAASNLQNLLNSTNPDIILLDINQPTEYDKYTTLITVLKDLLYSIPTSLIAISTVLTWNQTLKSSKKPLSEHQFKARKCSLKYKPIRALETLVLSTGKENLSPYIVASGLIYGGGESDLANYFRLAWMNEAKNGYFNRNKETNELELELPVLSEEKDEGKNLIPTIHIYDLISIIRFLIEQPPIDIQYIVATDNSQTSQLQLIQSITKTLNNGKIQYISPQSESVLLGGFDVIEPELISSDMRFEAEFTTTLPLEWHSEQGIQENTELIRKEYIEQRNLKPLRLWLTGAPASGKSVYSQILADKYYLPIINIKNIIEEAVDRKDEFSEQIQQQLTQASSNLAKSGKSGKKINNNNNNNSSNAANTKKSTGNNKASSSSVASTGRNKQLNSATELPDYETPRISSYLLSKLVKRKLREFEQRNKGFILDGWPKTAEEANYLFNLDLDEDDLGQPIHREIDNNNSSFDDNGNESKHNPNLEYRDPSTQVEFIIQFEIDESTAANRYRSLKQEEVIMGHNNEEGFRRRWNRYEIIANNTTEHSLNPLSVLSEVEVLQLPLTIAQNKPLSIQMIGTYIEKRGKPFNYHPTQAELNEQIAKQREEQQISEKKQAEENEEKEEEEKNRRMELETATNNRRSAIKLEELVLIEAAAQPLRGYLLEHVIPAVVDGLLDVCKQKPADPVDYLAEYLFKYALGAPLDQPLPTIQQ